MVPIARGFFASSLYNSFLRFFQRRYGKSGALALRRPYDSILNVQKSVVLTCFVGARGVASANARLRLTQKAKWRPRMPGSSDEDSRMTLSAKQLRSLRNRTEETWRGMRSLLGQEKTEKLRDAILTPAQREKRRRRRLFSIRNLLRERKKFVSKISEAEAELEDTILLKEFGDIVGWGARSGGRSSHGEASGEGDAAHDDTRVPVHLAGADQAGRTALIKNLRQQLHEVYSKRRKLSDLSWDMLIGVADIGTGGDGSPRYEERIPAERESDKMLIASDALMGELLNDPQTRAVLTTAVRNETFFRGGIKLTTEDDLDPSTEVEIPVFNLFEAKKRVRKEQTNTTVPTSQAFVARAYRHEERHHEWDKVQYELSFQEAHHAERLGFDHFHPLLQLQDLSVAKAGVAAGEVEDGSPAAKNQEKKHRLSPKTVLLNLLLDLSIRVRFLCLFEPALRVAFLDR